MDMLAVHRAARPLSRRRSIGRLAAREERTFWLFLLPWILGFIAFTGGPIIATLFLSLTDYTATTAPTWAGVHNYTTLFGDPLFQKSLLVTAYYTALSVPSGLVVSLALALLLNQQVRGRGIFRTIFYLPTVIPAVAVALVFQWMLNPDVGLANNALNVLHLPKLYWFQDESTVIPAFALMSLWSVGGSMIVFLAALQAVPLEIYEAAALDGATAWRKFMYLTLPLISPAILFNVVTGVIAALQVFTPAYVIGSNTSGGASNGDVGGPNYASEFYVLYLFQNAFQYFKFGYAAAQAWILFLIILALTVAMLRASRRAVYYEA